jgi:uncharacterized membrane protein
MLVWWNKMIFGYSVYDVMLWFIIYSILGWVVESIYMSICNKEITNRGFARGPMCPIYGAGAVLVFFALRRYSHHLFVIFFLGMFLATALEFIVALLMKKYLGEIWWDYSNKPFNFKGILCLESSIAWGLYAVIFFSVGHKSVQGFVNELPTVVGKVAGTVILILYAADFLTVLYQEKKEDIPDSLVELKEGIIEKRGVIADKIRRFSSRD